MFLKSDCRIAEIHRIFFKYFGKAKSSTVEGFSTIEGYLRSEKFIGQAYCLLMRGFPLLRGSSVVGG